VSRKLSVAALVALVAVGCATRGAAWRTSDRELRDLDDAAARDVCTEIDPTVARVRASFKRVACASVTAMAADKPPDAASCERAIEDCVQKPHRCDSKGDPVESCRRALREADCGATVREVATCFEQLATVMGPAADYAARSACGAQAPQPSMSVPACEALRARCPKLPIVSIDIRLGPPDAPCP
jgi:hypothetical protein